jgi:hypothetical protein
MRVQLFTFRFSPTLGAFDDTPLKDFVRDKEVLAFREHFFVVSDVPHVLCVVTFQDTVVPPEAIAEARAVAATTATARDAYPHRSLRSGGRNGEQRPDPAAGLDEAARAIFNMVREWRAKTAHKEGVPPYVILTNKEVVRIVMAKPASVTALGHVEGIGPGKVERYGSAILACLNGAPKAAPPAPAHANGAAAPSPEVQPAAADGAP